MFQDNADIALIFVTHWTVLYKKRVCLLSHTSLTSKYSIAYLVIARLLHIGKGEPLAEI